MKKRKFKGKAKCFDGEPSALNAVLERKIKPGDVIVIRYEGPKGSPGMPEMLSTTGAIYGQGLGEEVALILMDVFLEVHMDFLLGMLVLKLLLEDLLD